MPGVFPAFADCAPNPVPPDDLMGFVNWRYGLGLRSWEDVAPRPTGLPALAVNAFPNAFRCSARRCDCDPGAYGSGTGRRTRKWGELFYEKAIL